MYRYTKGDDMANALDFKTLSSNGTYSHTNNNAAAPTGYNLLTGYTNTLPNAPGFGSSPRPDVWYKFQIPTGGKNVTFSRTSTAFLKMILLDANGSEITSSTNFFMERELCEGVYYIVVDGAGSDASTSEGVFTLDITTAPHKGYGGMIEASSSIVCEGGVIPAINSTETGGFGEIALFGGLGNLPVYYKWFKWENAGPWVEVPGANEATLSEEDVGTMPDSVAGEDIVYFYRQIHPCTNDDFWFSSNTVTINSIQSEVNPGRVEAKYGCDYQDPRNGNEVTIPVGFTGFCFGTYNEMINGVDSFFSPSGFPEPITTQWQIKEPGAMEFQNLGGLNCCFDPIESTFGSEGVYQLRRLAISDCNLKRSSDTVTVTVLPRSGVIKGNVTTASIPITGIEYAYVCAVPINDILGGAPSCDSTDSEGRFVITELYHGNQAIQYRVFPSLEDHTFAKSQFDMDTFRVVTLQQFDDQPDGIDFVDLTVNTVSGNVFQSINHESSVKMFGKSKVVMFVDDVAKDTTDAMGNYSVVIDNPGTYTLRPELLVPTGSDGYDHTFSPATQVLLVSSNLDNINFEDLTKSQLFGFVGAGCDNYLGTVNLRLFQETNDGKFDLTFRTNNNGYIIEELPAREYKIEVTSEPIQKFDDSKYSRADVNAQYATYSHVSSLSHTADSTLRFYYKAPPTLELIDFPSGIAGCAGTSFDFPVLEQDRIYPDFKIKVWEGPISAGCPVDTGFVDIKDEIGGSALRGDRIGIIPISKGNVNFQLYARDPNIVAPYTKGLTILAKDFVNTAGADSTIRVIVTGERPREFEIATVSPEIPLLVVHDPPGDQSYAYVKQNETFETTLRTYKKETDSNGKWGKVKIGHAASFSTGMLFTVGFDVEAWGTIEGNHDVTERSNSLEESTITLSTNTEYATNLAQDGVSELIYDEGDIFIGGAYNMKYALTDVIRFNETTCEVEEDVDFALDADPMVTTFIKTTRGIENTINQLKSNIINNPDSANYWQNQVNVWEETIAANRERKEMAVKNQALYKGNYSTDGAIQFRKEVTSTTASTNSVEIWLEIDEGTSKEMKIEAAGKGVNGGTYHQFKIETGDSKEQKSLKSFTAGFTLSDGEADDFVVVDVYEDPVYKTPIFNYIGGRSSCPYEGSGDPLHKFEVVYDPAFSPSQSDIIEGVGQEYKLNITNTGAFQRDYLVSVEDAYNPDGAEIRLAGKAAGIPSVQDINIGVTKPVSIIVDKLLASSTFAYPNLRINIEPNCKDEGDTGSRKYKHISAYFRTECSDIFMEKPLPNEEVTMTTNTFLPVLMTGYDKSKLTSVKLEYRIAGQGIWKSSADIDFLANELSDLASGTEELWNTAEIAEDGIYELRLKVICPTGVNYSGINGGVEPITMIVDRTPPEVFGIPSPRDDEYDQQAGDLLSADYNEPISCANASVQFIDEINGDVLGGTIQCNGKIVSVIPNPTDAFTNRDPSAYRVIISGVEDMVGNVGEPFQWIFTVGEFDYVAPLCQADLAISNNNNALDAIAVKEYKALNIASEGQIENFGTTIFSAQEDIQMNMGFEVKGGGIFQALIEDCVNE